jgi:voltage-gated potassium channel
MKQRVFEIIEKADDGDVSSKVFDWVILILIVLNVLSIIIMSFDNIAAEFGTELYYFEVFSVIVFSIEYLLRMWTADLKYPQYGPVKSRVRLAFSFMAIIDLLAILPFYLPLIVVIDLRFLRMFRLARIFRIFKLNRYSKALNHITKVIKDKKEELLTSVFIMLFIIVLSSTLIYFIEHDMQPEAFPNIVASFWWAICTLTTVGYGDVYPITLAGKVLASIIAVSGIGLVALPTGIISSGFMDHISSDTVCPHCGKKYGEE